MAIDHSNGYHMITLMQKMTLGLENYDCFEFLFMNVNFHIYEKVRQFSIN
jgi:hypothetical protein